MSHEDKVILALQDGEKYARQVAEFTGLSITTVNPILKRLTADRRARFVRRHVGPKSKAKFYALLP